MEKAFEESFEKVYELISFDSKNLLKIIKKKLMIYLMSILFVMIAIILCMYLKKVEQYQINGTVVLEIAILLFFIITAKTIYRKKYKEIIISTLVKGYNEKLNYSTTSNINTMIYKSSEFDRDFNEFYSEDGINGTINENCRIQLSEVATFKVSTYVDNGQKKEDKILTYRGMFGVARLNKNIISEISILNDSHSKKFSKERIEVDSAEFEEYYDLLTRDKVLALRIFTSELVEKLNDIRKINKNKYPFELKIRENMIYFRYKCGQIFEPPTFTNGLNKELIKKYYRLIYYPLEIVNATANNINYVVEMDS